MSEKTLKDKAIEIHGRKYVQVADRVKYLSDNVEQYSIESDYEFFEATKTWVVKATLTVGENVYVGLAQEIETDRGVNATSALENAQTSAVGRACAMAGIGVLDSIASTDEINKAKNREVTFD